MTHQAAGYCNRCPKSARCWGAMKARAAQLLPAAAAEFERLHDEGKQGRELIAAWQELTKDEHGKSVVDPYTAVMLANVEAGAQMHETGLWSATRGTLSPPCPLVPVSEATS